MKKGWVVLGFAILFLLIAIGGAVNYCNRTIAPNTIDKAFVSYEEFQEIYNTCQKLNTDLGNMKLLSPDDVMFQQFSKEQRILTIKTQLNRWVEDYNAKSKMWNRNMWKSNKLPYQLQVYEFSNY